MLTITVAQDGSGDFASVSEAVLAVPYACAAEIRIGPGVIAKTGVRKTGYHPDRRGHGKHPHRVGRRRQAAAPGTAGPPTPSAAIPRFPGIELRVRDLTMKTMPAPGQRWGRPWRLMWTALTPSLRMCGC